LDRIDLNFRLIQLYIPVAIIIVIELLEIFSLGLWLWLYCINSGNSNRFDSMSFMSFVYLIFVISMYVNYFYLYSTHWWRLSKVETFILYFNIKSLFSHWKTL